MQRGAKPRAAPGRVKSARGGSMKDSRTFLRWLGGLPVLGRYLSPLPSPQPGRGGGAPPTVAATPTALYQQPEGRRNLVRIAVTGLDAPAGPARVPARRGALGGSAGLLPAGPGRLREGWRPVRRTSPLPDIPRV